MALIKKKQTNLCPCVKEVRDYLALACRRRGRNGAREYLICLGATAQLKTLSGVAIYEAGRSVSREEVDPPCHRRIQQRCTVYSVKSQSLPSIKN